jgi:hypothetical protein
MSIPRKQATLSTDNSATFFPTVVSISKCDFCFSENVFFNFSCAVISTIFLGGLQMLAEGFCFARENRILGCI